MRRIWIAIGAWAAATLAAAVVAWGAVGLVGDQVSESGSLPLTSDEVAAIAEARTTPSQATTTVPASSVPDSTATTTTAPTTAPSTTPASPPSTTTTTAGEETQAISVEGGVVVVRWSPSTGVRLTSASPAQGWSVEIEHAGPPSVEVKFEGPGEVETEVHIEVSGSELVVDTHHE